MCNLQHKGWLSKTHVMVHVKTAINQKSTFPWECVARTRMVHVGGLIFGYSSQNKAEDALLWSSRKFLFLPSNQFYCQH